jgi:arylsulfatase A
MMSIGKKINLKVLYLLGALSSLSLIMFLFLGNTYTSPASLRDQPNIIFVLMDDLGYETAILGDSIVGIGTSKPIVAPVMKQHLQSNSLVFSNAYSSPVCTPSRVQISTGDYLYRSYQQFGQLNWNARTLAQNLLWNGYNTMVCGKWQMQGNIAFVSPSKFEEDYSTIDIENPRRLGYKDYLLHAVKENGQIYANCSSYYYQNDSVACNPGDFGPYVVLEYFKSFINKHKNSNRPFFIDYRMLLPHDPFQPVPSHPDYPNDTINNARYLPEMITLTDSIIGAIIEEVDKTPELHQGAGTAVIIYSDNGSSRGWITNNPEGNPATGWGIFTKINNVGEYNGNKSLSTYLGCHIPAFAYYVGPYRKYTPGEIYSAPIGLVDVYATILDLAKLWQHSKKDGISFADKIVTYIPNQPNREILFQYYHPFFESVTNQRQGTNVNSFATNGDFWLDSRGRFYNLKDSMDWELLDPLTPGPGEEQLNFELLDSVLQLHPKAEEFNKPLFTPN